MVFRRHGRYQASAKLSVSLSPGFLIAYGVSWPMPFLEVLFVSGLFSPIHYRRSARWAQRAMGKAFKSNKFRGKAEVTVPSDRLFYCTELYPEMRVAQQGPLQERLCDQGPFTAVSGHPPCTARPL